LRRRERPRLGQRLTEGLVITIKPILAAGKGEVSLTPRDDWTLKTGDGSCAAHFEHTIVFTDLAPIILTDLTRTWDRAVRLFA
jgi:methionyl aminopeptidase